jgi:hypothetical protein
MMRIYLFRKWKICHDVYRIHQEKEVVGFYAKSFMMFFMARVGIHLHLEGRPFASH